MLHVQDVQDGLIVCLCWMRRIRKDRDVCQLEEGLAYTGTFRFRCYLG